MEGARMSSCNKGEKPRCEYSRAYCCAAIWRKERGCRQWEAVRARALRAEEEQMIKFVYYGGHVCFCPSLSVPEPEYLQARLRAARMAQSFDGMLMSW
jgi:hypothetical protein